jgi:hypothetical protein
MEEVGEGNLLRFCMEEIELSSLKNIFQMARSQVTDILSSRYNICAAYGTVMCSVVEQVANFKLTNYSTDGRGLEEIEFEKQLHFNRFGGFVLDITKKADDDLQVNEETLKMFLRTFRSLGDKVLLHRGGMSTKAQGDIEGDADEAIMKDQKSGRGPSFSSDRRIARLVIARYWADGIMTKFREKMRPLQTISETSTCADAFSILHDES